MSLLLRVSGKLSTSRDGTEISDNPVSRFETPLKSNSFVFIRFTKPIESLVLDCANDEQSRKKISIIRKNCMLAFSAFRVIQ
ncbi:hypothetical protein [Fluviicola chungangensis]|uniref:Uncharacterized protein n=1 Tax=Fluviicola chungangensis TaxID=2597671 RepID=A0A556MPI5_9FLAO|nr:hypothetical protein [Fluviicola chungangensis]TSJ41867.1 hypothetical protein FO442_12300 [Fluviicola chungangensis]